MVWRTCLVPILLQWAFVLALWLNAARILSFSVPVGPVVVPVLPFLIALSALATLAPFVGHFSPAVPDPAAWLAILLAGFGVIVAFALIQSTALVICTAPVCDGGVTFYTDGQSLADAASPGAEPVELVGTFRTGFYFSIVTFTTLGYGDMQPRPEMRLYAAFEALLGYLYLGLIVGSAIDFGGRTGRGAGGRAG